MSASEGALLLCSDSDQGRWGYVYGMTLKTNGGDTAAARQTADRAEPHAAAAYAAARKALYESGLAERGNQ